MKNHLYTIIIMLAFAFFILTTIYAVELALGIVGAAFFVVTYWIVLSFIREGRRGKERYKPSPNRTERQRLIEQMRQKQEHNRSFWRK